MPINAEQVKDMQVGVTVKAGRKVDGDKIVDAVVETGQYWTVMEVLDKLVPKEKGKPKIRRFRTKKILDRACTDHKVGQSIVKARLARYWDGKRFHYGIPI